MEKNLAVIFPVSNNISATTLLGDIRLFLGQLKAPADNLLLPGALAYHQAPGGDRCPPPDPPAEISPVLVHFCVFVLHMSPHHRRRTSASCCGSRYILLGLCRVRGFSVFSKMLQKQGQLVCKKLLEHSFSLPLGRLGFWGLRFPRIHFGTSALMRKPHSWSRAGSAAAPQRTVRARTGAAAATVPL